jgi:uncharacterized protein (TIGR02284 family)
MNTSTDEIVEILSSLTTECRSAQRRYQVAAERAENFELRAFFGDCSRLRNEMADDLRQALRALDFVAGETDRDLPLSPQPWSPSETLEANDDARIIMRCRSGEETAVEEFRGAVEHGLPAEIAALVRRQFAVIVATCERLRSLERSYKQRSR